MIKVVFKYQTAISDLEELMEKFKLSADPKFKSEVSNIKIEMSRQVNKEDVVIQLDIYYQTIEDYQIRTKFERENKDWCAIWFDENNKHKELSVEIFEVMQ